MITINDLNKSENFFLMAGPCVIEGEDMALRIAEKIVGITERLHITLCIQRLLSESESLPSGFFHGHRG